MARQPYSRNYRRDFNRGPRKNERIRSREVRVIGPTGDQIGVMATDKAVALAKKAGYDLVEIAANATPPVCRILDFGKYMYEQSKKGKDSKGSTTSKIKEVKFRVRTGEHDYITKLRHAEEFLDKGNKVKITLTFRGRENEHKELGFDTVNRAISDLSNVGSSESPPRLAGRNIFAMISPLPANKRKPRFVEPQNQPAEKADSKPAKEEAEKEQKEESNAQPKLENVPPKEGGDSQET